MTSVRVTVNDVPVFVSPGDVITGRVARRLPMGSLVAWVKDREPSTRGRFRNHRGEWFPALGGNDERYEVLYLPTAPTRRGP